MNKIDEEEEYPVYLWMTKELELKGLELLVFAIIHRDSIGEQKMYRKGLRYLTEMTGGTKQGIIKCLRSLVKKGYIAKSEEYINKVRHVNYCLGDTYYHF